METITVRADQIKKGDLFKGSKVWISEPRENNETDWYFATEQVVDGPEFHIRFRWELVEVERPAKTLTVTVELTEDEAEYAIVNWSSGCSAAPVIRLCTKIAAAVREAQQG